LALGDARHLSPRRGTQFWYDWLFDGDIVHADGLPVTRPVRAVCATALRARSLEDTVRVVDLAAADDLVSVGEVRAYAERLRGRPHTRRLRAALDLADENVWSPQEVTLRVRWRACRPSVRLLCNPPLFARDGAHLFTPDLLDPEAGVVGQYDGAVHEATRVRRRDLRTEELCRELGLEVVSMISTDLRDLRSFDGRLEAAYGRAARRRTQGWTLAQPAWWVDTSTVGGRRALGEEDRRRWLRHRAS
jgi:hypothetical protein